MYKFKKIIKSRQIFYKWNSESYPVRDSASPLTKTYRASLSFSVRIHMQYQLHTKPNSHLQLFSIFFFYQRRVAWVSGIIYHSHLFNVFIFYITYYIILVYMITYYVYMLYMYYSTHVYCPITCMCTSCATCKT